MKELVTTAIKVGVVGIAYGAGAIIGVCAAKPIGCKIARKISEKINKKTDEVEEEIKEETGD